MNSWDCNLAIIPNSVSTDDPSVSENVPPVSSDCSSTMTISSAPVMDQPQEPNLKRARLAQSAALNQNTPITNGFVSPPTSFDQITRSIPGSVESVRTMFDKTVKINLQRSLETHLNRLFHAEVTVKSLKSEMKEIRGRMDFIESSSVELKKILTKRVSLPAPTSGVGERRALSSQAPKVPSQAVPRCTAPNDIPSHTSVVTTLPHASLPSGIDAPTPSTVSYPLNSVTSLPTNLCPNSTVGSVSNASHTSVRVTPITNVVPNNVKTSVSNSANVPAKATPSSSLVPNSRKTSIPNNSHIAAKTTLPPKNLVPSNCKTISNTTRSPLPQTSLIPVSCSSSISTASNPLAGSPIPFTPVPSNGTVPKPSQQLAKIATPGGNVSKVVMPQSTPKRAFVSGQPPVVDTTKTNNERLDASTKSPICVRPPDTIDLTADASPTSSIVEINTSSDVVSSATILPNPSNPCQSKSFEHTIKSSAISQAPTNYSSSTMGPQAPFQHPAQNPSNIQQSSRSAWFPNRPTPLVNRAPQGFFSPQQLSYRELQMLPVAPLPPCPVPTALNCPVQPMPQLTIAEAMEGVCLQWTIAYQTMLYEIATGYEIYSYASSELTHETIQTCLPWKKVGEVAALPLPMACTLTHVQSSNMYYFIVRSVDRFHRYSAWSNVVNAYVA